ncbi:unnamed protein product [Prorocentrum cordatum]|uniref:Uncharacterized protein n=1 Tax=Prorocentrum cordatum TaxID=2364126 RepID=A0ABN9PUT9_9DINO|nr:unnamed protein product [Polarella glacialis]
MASASSSTSSLRGSAQMGGLRPFDRSDAPHGPCCATRLRHQVPAAEVGPSTAERGLGLHSAAADTWGYPELKNKKALAQPGARGAQRSTVPSDVCTYPQATALKRDAAHGGAPPWALMQPAARFGRHSWQEDLGRRRRIGAGRKRREEVRGCGVGGQGQIKRAPAGTPRMETLLYHTRPQRNGPRQVVLRYSAVTARLGRQRAHKQQHAGCQSGGEVRAAALRKMLVANTHHEPYVSAPVRGQSACRGVGGLISPSARTANCVFYLQAGTALRCKRHRHSQGQTEPMHHCSR